MSEFDFQITREGAVARLDLNRPGEGNALTRAMMRRLAAAIRELGSDETIHVIVVEGRGPQFCTGRDGKGEDRSGMTPYDVRVHMMGAVLDAYQAVADAQVPVVALVHGDALGFGAALAAACDITLAAADAAFAFPEIEHDIPPTMAMCAALGKVPEKALAYLIYSAEKIDAASAVSLGLASKVLAAETFRGDGLAFVRQLAARPRRVLEIIKRYQGKAGRLPPDMAAEYAGTLLALVRS
ncbi:2,3-dehydroadipyl-CoA hydratase [Pigmentiphaga humi]|uniref:2,3-dehydroadipyl-CoA hydratase n=1 Tax=Pigmentiphaga humi TaxID=2478468 RepID=A0A3P4AXX2_9BURK|nr:enoyl-CoA hydratase/isomerase family protein [Pigmentiphaga humi]VCU68632.1 2,3-dehydroadipyl-CoA hydratase [Pigmentiphaga humi]